MSKEFSRAQRVADEIQRELAQLIQREVRDPRFGMVTISAVKVSKDLSYAKVYVTVLGDEVKTTEVVKALNKAAGFFRSLLARTMRLRVAPGLHFVYDSSVASGVKISALIDEAITSDQKHKKSDE